MRDLLLFVLCVSLLVSVVFAVDADFEDTEPTEDYTYWEPDPFEVCLDDNTVTAILDGFSDALSAFSPAPAAPSSVELSPEAVDQLAGAIADALAQDPVSPAAVSGLSGGYYITVNCALGNGLTFYLPSEFANDSLAFDNSSLVNLSNSSIYLFPTDSRFSSYTIYAPRFGHFQYRTTGTAAYQDLRISAVTDSNVRFMSDTSFSLPDSVFTWVFVFFGVLIFFFLVRRH